MKALTVPAAALALLLGTAALAQSPSSLAAEPAAKPVVVHIAGFAFKPATLTVAAGQTVEFVNDDSDAHTVTATDKAFDSGGLDTNDHWSHTFGRPGTYRYLCALHPYMKGTIIVTQHAPQSEATP